MHNITEKHWLSASILHNFWNLVIGKVMTPYQPRSKRSMKQRWPTYCWWISCQSSVHGSPVAV